MNIQWLYWLGSIAIAFLAFFYGRKDREKQDKKQEEQEVKQEVRQDTILDLNVEYIKKSVDQMFLEQRETNRKLEKQAADFVDMQLEQRDVQSSLKSLHKRVDRVESYIDKCRGGVINDG